MCLLLVGRLASRTGEVDESMPRQIAILDVIAVSTGIETAKIVFSVEFWV